MVQHEPLRREQLGILAVLAVLTGAAWALTVCQMGGMGSMMGGSGMPSDVMGSQAGMAGEVPMENALPELGLRLVLFLSTWVTMMVAMMLPSAAPMILMFGMIHR